jgi:hypothetical protein
MKGQQGEGIVDEEFLLGTAGCAVHIVYNPGFSHFHKCIMYIFFSLFLSLSLCIARNERV